MSHDPVVPVVLTAAPPFANPAADTIIRSCDGVDFHVRSGIIAEASPIFSDMFEIPQPVSSHEDGPDYLGGKPVVAVAEDSLTLDRLLRLCYPVPDPVLEEPKDVCLVLATALKYDMEEAVLLMTRSLSNFIQGQPLAVWAMACTLRLEDVARAAATVLLGCALPAPVPPELWEVTAGTYFRLVKFHRAGGNVRERFRFCEPNPEDIPNPIKSHNTLATVIFYQSRPFPDIICRSSDGQEFYTHRIILCAASPLLQEQVISLPSEPMPTLDFKVRGEILGAALELCYPVKHGWLGGLPVLQAIDMIDFARQQRMGALFDQLYYSAFGSLVVAHPLATYLLASKLDLSKVAESALRYLHGDPFTYGCIPEMETTPAVPYHRLYVNRRESLAVASKMTSTLTRLAPALDGSIAPVINQAVTAAEGMTIDDAGDPWLRDILQHTVELLRSPDQDRWWVKPQTSTTLEKSVDRRLWCAPCEDNVRLVLRIEKIYDDVRKAMDENNRKLLSTPLGI